MYVDQKNIKKSLHILEDCASGVQVGAMEQAYVQILLQIRERE